MKRDFLAAHGGDLILAVFAVLALVAYTVATVTGHDDQTLGNLAIGALSALGGYMSKRTSAQGQTTNVDSATNVAVNPPAEPKPTSEE